MTSIDDDYDMPEGSRLDRIEADLRRNGLTSRYGLGEEAAGLVDDLMQKHGVDVSEAMALGAMRSPAAFGRAADASVAAFASLRPRAGGEAPKPQGNPTIADHVAYANRLAGIDKRAMKKHLSDVYAHHAAKAIGWECPLPKIGQ